jgi:hypothetical protein
MGDHVILKLLELACKGIWENLEMWAKETLECDKHNSIGKFGGSSEDQHDDNNTMDSEGQSMRFQMGIRTLLGIGLKAMEITFWQRICLHFCLCLENLWETEFKIMD